MVNKGFIYFSLWEPLKRQDAGVDILLGVYVGDILSILHGVSLVLEGKTERFNLCLDNAALSRKIIIREVTCII